MIGQLIQNYQITSRLGEGGMGIVYKATDTVLGREVALKMLHAQLIQQSQFLERFKKEARVLAQLLHPNIAVIYNFIAQNENHFMVMEYVQGKNLDELVKEHGTLSYEIVCPIFMQALEGLHHAHKKGIFHRDIKPSNLILTPDGTVKLMDFGIAKIAGEQRLTQVNRVVGTVEFMAPELIEGKDPSVASDIYATGVTLYELLTGKLPFEGTTDFNLMQDILKKKPISAEKLNANVPKALSNIVMKALEKKPEQRFTDAKAFQLALLAAFPVLKDADLSKINSFKKAVPETQVVQIFSHSGRSLKPTALSEKATNPASQFYPGLLTVKDKLLSKKNRLVLIGVLSVLVFLVVGFSLFSGNEVKDKKKEDISTGITGTNDSKKTDSTSLAINEKPVNSDQFTPPPVKNTPPEVKEPTREPEIKEEKKEKNKEKENKKDDGKKEPVKEKITEKKDPVKEPEKKELPPVIPPVEKKELVIAPPEVRKNKTVTLNNRLEVNLFLKDAITESTAKEGQTLNFSVINSVVYNGETIIERGAQATGRIKNMTNKKMTIVISSVTAANGQRIPFQEVDLSGRYSEILSSRNYSAMLKRGITINF